MTPAAWQPVQDLLQAGQAGTGLHLHLGEAAACHTPYQAFHWLHVVGHQDPPVCGTSDIFEGSCSTFLLYLENHVDLYKQYKMLIML